MRCVVLASAFVLILAAPAPAKAQLTVDEEDVYEYVNNQEGYIYTAGDSIRASMQVAVMNADPFNDYTVYLSVEIYDSSMNRVASALTTFTADAAQDGMTPTTTTGGLSCSYTVPSAPNDDSQYTVWCSVFRYVNEVKMDLIDPYETWFFEG